MGRVEFISDFNNKLSIAVMGSIVSKKEGVMRNQVPTLESDERRKNAIQSILRNESFDGVKESGKQIVVQK